MTYSAKQAEESRSKRYATILQALDGLPPQDVTLDDIQVLIGWADFERVFSNSLSVLGKTLYRLAEGDPHLKLKVRGLDRRKAVFSWVPDKAGKQDVGTQNVRVKIDKTVSETILKTIKKIGADEAKSVSGILGKALADASKSLVVERTPSRIDLLPSSDPRSCDYVQWTEEDPAPAQPPKEDDTILKVLSRSLEPKPLPTEPSILDEAVADLIDKGDKDDETVPGLSLKDYTDAMELAERLRKNQPARDLFEFFYEATPDVQNEVVRHVNRLVGQPLTYLKAALDASKHVEPSKPVEDTTRRDRLIRAVALVDLLIAQGDDAERFQENRVLGDVRSTLKSELGSK